MGRKRKTLSLSLPPFPWIANENDPNLLLRLCAFLRWDVRTWRQNRRERFGQEVHEHCGRTNEHLPRVVRPHSDETRPWSFPFHRRPWSQELKKWRKVLHSTTWGKLFFFPLLFSSYPFVLNFELCSWDSLMFLQKGLILKRVKNFIQLHEIQMNKKKVFLHDFFIYFKKIFSERNIFENILYEKGDRRSKKFLATEIIWKLLEKKILPLMIRNNRKKF